MSEDKADDKREDEERWAVLQEIKRAAEERAEKFLAACGVEKKEFQASEDYSELKRSEIIELLEDENEKLNETIATLTKNNAALTAENTQWQTQYVALWRKIARMSDALIGRPVPQSEQPRPQ